MGYDIFISYRRQCSKDKAELLWTLLQDGYKDRVSFDRDNLNGQFAPEIITRIDNCKDFVLLIDEKTFDYKDADFALETVELYNYLSSCSLDEFKVKLEELGVDAKLDFVRIEISRALRVEGLNIIPVIPFEMDMSRLNLPSDIKGIKRYHACNYSDSRDAKFNGCLSSLKSLLKSKPVRMKKSLYAGLFAVLISILAFVGVKFFNSEPKINDYAYVDLGLSVLWADSNLGSNSVYNKDKFFAWGESESKSSYDRSSSITHNVSLSDISGNVKYDAARIVMGEPWRIPTREEVQELIDKCMWSWNNGGYKITGPNGNSIFLPCDGYYEKSVIHNGVNGYYWVSTPDESDASYAGCLIIRDPKVINSKDKFQDKYRCGFGHRYLGRSIRPVASKK